MAQELPNEQQKTGPKPQLQTEKPHLQPLCFPLAKFPLQYLFLGQLLKRSSATPVHHACTTRGDVPFPQRERDTFLFNKSRCCVSPVAEQHSLSCSHSRARLTSLCSPTRMSIIAFVFLAAIGTLLHCFPY